MLEPTQNDEAAEMLTEWYAGIENLDWMGSPAVESPNMWCHLKYPVEAERFGNAFLEDKSEHGQRRPLFCNIDFHAAILGGQP